LLGTVKVIFLCLAQKVNNKSLMKFKPLPVGIGGEAVVGGGGGGAVPPQAVLSSVRIRLIII
jgi:hypothetical protein